MRRLPTRTSSPSVTAMLPAAWTLPTLLVYIVLGRFFMRGLLAGSLKG